MEQMNKQEYMAMQREMHRLHAETMRDTIIPALQEVLESVHSRELTVNAEAVAEDKAARSESRRESMRDAFACQALQGLLASFAHPNGSLPRPSENPELADYAYGYADLLLKARSK